MAMAPTVHCIALRLALHTGILHCCPVHGTLYTNDESDPGMTFGMARALTHRRAWASLASACTVRELTDSLTDALSAAFQAGCPACVPVHPSLNGKRHCPGGFQTHHSPGRPRGFKPTANR
jgi:hypothetical protein